jgi:hypothetical protein
MIKYQKGFSDSEFNQKILIEFHLLFGLHILNFKIIIKYKDLNQIFNNYASSKSCQNNW